MNVTLGAYLLSGTPGYRQAGIHQYIRALIETLAVRPEVLSGEVNLTALISPTARNELQLPALQSPREASNSQFPISLLSATRNTESPLTRMRVEQLETPRLLREVRADLYHGLAFVAPLRSPCPTVITVHDLSFITRPQTHKLMNRTYLSILTRLSCRRAARVIAVSEWTKRDVVSLLGIAPERVDVIPHGAHARFRPLPAAEVAAFRAANGIGAAPAVFFLGSLEPRKNLPALIDAFGAVLKRVPEAELHIGGSPGWKYQDIFERIAALGLKARVHFCGQIAQEQLPLWYNACAVFAYPSLYEGFGMPVLEAMACGAPVVTSNVTSLPEVVGDAGLMVSPQDVAGLADALAGVLTNADLRDTLRTKSLRRAAGFTWDHTAEMTIQTYRKVFSSNT
jgi:glycosyltransferase involved in cell wall biosynthesis